MAAPASSHGMIEALASTLLDVQALIDAAPASSMLLDRDGRILTINRAGAARLGLAPAQALGLYLFDLFPVEVAASRQRRLQAVTASRQPQVFEDHRDGQHYRTSAVPVMDRDGEVCRVAIFSEDITAQHETERLLRDSEAHYRFLAENSEDVIWQLDRDMHITYISAADQRLRGVARGAVLGQSVFSLFSPRGQAILARVVAERQQCLEQGLPLPPTLRFEAPQQCANGEEVWVEVVSTRIDDAHGVLCGYIGMTRNVAERRRYQAMLEDANRQLREQLDKVSALQAQLQARAHRDALTGLYNRHYLHETLPDLLAQARQARHGLALVMVDLDHFKQINDRHGHVAGDLAIQTAARLLIERAPSRSLCCRFGGEEFLVALCGLTPAAVCAWAENWCAELADCVLSHQGVRIALTASLGVAWQPQHGDSEAQLLERADQALYLAKRRGRNQVCVWAADEVCALRT